MGGRIADWNLPGAYGLAHFGKSLFWQASEILFIFYLTEVCAIPARPAGLVLGSALLFSAVADLVVARGLGRSMASASAAAVWQLRGVGLSAVALLLFALTAAAPPAHRLILALAASLLFRAAYAVTDVPQNAMLGLLARDEPDRTRLSAVRFVAGGLAALVVSGLAALLIQSVSAKRAHPETIMVVVGLDVVAVASAALLCRVTRRTRETAALAAPVTMGFGASLGFGAAPVLLTMGFALSATAPVFSKLEPYFAAYALRSATGGGLILGGGAVGGLVSQALWAGLSRRVSRVRVMAMAAGLMSLGAVGFLAGASNSLALAVVGALLVGAGLGGLGMASWAALADACAPGRGDRPSTVVVFGGFTFASKLGLALATVLVSEVLAAHRYATVVNAGVWPLLPLMCLAPIAGAAAILVLARRLEHRAVRLGHVCRLDSDPGLQALGDKRQ